MLGPVDASCLSTDRMLSLKLGEALNKDSACVLAFKNRFVKSSPLD